MNRYLRAIVRPEQDRWFRLGTLVVYLILGVWNLWIAVDKAIHAETLWWLTNLSASLFIIGCGVFVIRIWAGTDDDIRARRHPETSVIPVTRPEDAADPFAYAMMMAFHDGSPSAIYRGNDGIWRDSDTDEPIPVQESDGRTEPKDKS